MYVAKAEEHCTRLHHQGRDDEAVQDSDQGAGGEGGDHSWEIIF